MVKRILFLYQLIILYSVDKGQVQPDTIIVYDVATQTIGTILPVAFNASTTSDKTSSYVGSMGNKVNLTLIPPTSNLFNGSNFNIPARAADFFSMSDYPIRTAVAIRSYSNNLTTKLCSGMIISPNFVMTAAFCVFDYYNGAFNKYDSLKVLPGFNNGVVPPGISPSLVKKIYIFKTLYDKTNYINIALLELKKPIGLQTGWTGIGYDSSPNFVTNKVFHKFSYPTEAAPGFPDVFNGDTLYYNGDTLFYNYGYVIDNSFGFGIPGAMASLGMGGSTFLYTDNNDFYSVGVLNYATGYLSNKIENKIFYQLKHVIETNLGDVSVKENNAQDINMKLYPNPFNQEATLEFDYKPGEQYTLLITDGLGQIAKKAIPVNNGRISIQKESLEKGLYFLQLRDNNARTFTVKMVVE